MNNNPVSDKLEQPFSCAPCSTDSSIDREGKTILAGREISRLKIGEDSRFYPAACKIDAKSNWFISFITYLKTRTIFEWGLYVKVKTADNSHLIVDVNSLAKRLLISKAKIIRASKEKDFLNFLSQQALRAKTTIHLFEDIQRQSSSQKEGPVNKIDQSPKQIMKISRKALKIIENTQNFAVKITFNEKKSFLIQKGVDPSEGVDPSVYTVLDIGQQLGKGGFGAVSVAKNVHLKEETAFKESDTTYEARMSAKNEEEILSQIHAKGNVRGIQFKPRKLFYISSINATGKNLEVETTNKVGLLGEKYQKDYSEHIRNPEKPIFVDNEIAYSQSKVYHQKLIEFHQLLSGLSYLEEKGILHGDLKPENILFKESPQGPLVHIADFGGAVKTRKDNPQEYDEKVLGKLGKKHGFTPDFCLEKDIIKAYNTAQEKDTIPQEKVKSLFQMEHKRDVFAMGLIFIETLGSLSQKTKNSSTPAFTEAKKDEHPRGEYNEEGIKELHIPTEMQTLLAKMAHVDRNERPTATEALKELEKHIKKVAENDKAIQEKFKTAGIDITKANDEHLNKLNKKNIIARKGGITTPMKRNQR